MKYIALDNFELHNIITPGKFLAAPLIEGLELPAIRTTEFNKSGQDGVVVAQQFFGERRMLISGWSYNITSQSDYTTQRQAFTNAMSPLKDSSGNLLPRTLKFTADDGVQYRIKVQVMKATMPRQYMSSAQWTLDLLAIEPNIVSETQQNVSVSQYQGGGFILPVVVPIVSVAGTGAVVVATNNGLAAAYPVITFTGPLTNPQLSNDTSNTYMALALSLGVGESVAVDTYNRTIIQGGVTNRYSTKVAGSTFFTLAPGSSNLRLTSSVSGETGTATVSFRDSWVGV